MDNYKSLSETIPQKIKNSIGIVCDVNLNSRNGLYFIEIIITKQNTPVSYKGEYYYRTGSTLQVLRGRALTEFILKKSGKNWDEVTEDYFDFGNIDNHGIEAFKKGAAQSGRIINIENEPLFEILKNLKLIKDDKIKRAGIILFASDPTDYFPSAFIKIGRFGKTDTELIHQDVVEGAGYLRPDKTIEILNKKYLIPKIEYSGLQRIELSEYPLDAIREILLNAISHRVYSTAPIQISVYND